MPSLSFSQSKLTSIDQDKYYVEVLYKHVVKANQAFIEVEHLRFQTHSLERVIEQKDEAFQKLLAANKLSLERVKEYQITFAAQNVKNKKCEELVGKFETANRKLKIKNDFIQIGTPVLVVSVGVLGGIAGFYLKKYIL